MTCRLLPYGVADGPHNMAADEAMLETAAEGVASLRFYGWSEATLSLGYFQMEAARRRDESLARLPYVRRFSGGATLVHHHELTYALALPSDQPWQGAVPWLCRMHHIIAAALRSLDVGCDLVPGDSEPQRHDPVLCFRQWTAGDILVGGSKVVGSAQRKHRRALLQHGGILLAGSPFTPELSGITERSGRSLSSDSLQQTIRGEFARQTGWHLQPGDWTIAEQDRIEALVASRYASDGWNRKR